MNFGAIGSPSKPSVEKLQKASRALYQCVSDDVPTEVKCGVLDAHGSVLLDAVDYLLRQDAYDHEAERFDASNPRT